MNIIDRPIIKLDAFIFLIIFDTTSKNMRTKELNHKQQPSLKKVEDQVAFHPDGTPMTREEYKIALKTAEEQIKKGVFVSDI